MNTPSLLPTAALPSEGFVDGDAPPQSVAAAGERGRLEVRCATGIAGLASLRSDWDALVPALREARFHHRHAWQFACLCHLEPDPSQVHFFSIHRRGRPVAIFPLRQAVRRVSGIPLRVWEFPCGPHMDLCDALVAGNENSAVLLCELIRALEQRPGPRWDALHLPRLLDGSLALRALQAAPLSFVHLERTAQSMHFDCRDLDAAMRRANPQFMRNLRRQRRKLDRCGRIEVSMVREPEALETALADFLRIEASGWKGECGSAIALHREVESFYCDLVRRLGREGRCSINLLKLDGIAIAAQFALIDQRRMNLLKIAYDEAWAAEAPGSRLLHDVLCQCCESGEFDELSLVTGPSWAPGRWNPLVRDVSSAYVFNASPRGLAACLATRMKPVAIAALAMYAGSE